MKPSDQSPDDSQAKRRLPGLYKRFYLLLVRSLHQEYGDILSNDDIHDAVVDALIAASTIEVDPARGDLNSLIFTLCQNRTRDRIRRKKAFKRGHQSPHLPLHEASETEVAGGSLESPQRSGSKWWAALESVSIGRQRRLPERQKLILASIKAAAPYPLEDWHDFRAWWSDPGSTERIQAVLGEEVSADRLRGLTDQDITRGLQEVRKFLRTRPDRL